MRFNKLAALASVAILSLGLVACTADQTAEVEHDIQVACEILPVGTTFVVALTSSIPGGAAIAPIETTIGADAATVCGDLLATVEKVISDITSSGGSAVVSMSSSTASASPAVASHLRSLGAALHAKYGVKVNYSAGKLVVVVPPKGPFGF